MMKSIRHQRVSIAGVTVSSVPSRHFVACRSGDVDMDVESLLQRDRKPINVATSSAPSEAPSEKADPQDGKVVKSKESRRKAQRRQLSEAENAGPHRCKEAIDAGVSLFKEKKFDEAIAMLNLALELPGNGAYRLSGSIREFSCPSDAEEQACLYNMACCYCGLGKRPAALACLEGIIEQGFNDYETIRNDPDLQSLRGPELEALLLKGQAAGVLSFFTGKRDETTFDPNRKKSWFQW